MAFMNVWQRFFTAHPESVNENYWQHFTAAAGFGFRMIWGGIVCLVHAVIPGVCCTKGSDMIVELHERMVTNRRRIAESQDLRFGTRRAA
jgi:uncharacterized protein DUF6356